MLRKISVMAAAMIVASVLILSFGSSTTGLFHMLSGEKETGGRLDRIGDWIRVGVLEVRGGGASVLGP